VALACGLQEDVAVRAAQLLSLVPPYEDLARAGFGVEYAGGPGSAHDGGASSEAAGSNGGWGGVNGNGSSNGHPVHLNGYSGGSSWVLSGASAGAFAQGEGSAGSSSGSSGQGEAGAWHLIGGEGGGDTSTNSGSDSSSGSDGEAAAEPSGAPEEQPAVPVVPLAEAEPVMSAVVAWLADHGLLTQQPHAEVEATPAAAGEGAGHGSGEGAGGAIGRPDAPRAPLPRPLLVEAGRTQPQPGDSLRPCVYAVRWRRSGFFYGGSTNDVRQRYRQHGARGGPVDMLYVALDSGGGGGGGGPGGGAGGGWVALEGALAAAEGELIRRLRDAGFPMKSTRDARRKRRGRQ
jgi:hypothetical protein